MKIELKHLIPYLPYGLKSAANASHFGLKTHLVSDIDTYNVMNFIKGDTTAKPIMVPLSEMTLQIAKDCGYDSAGDFMIAIKKEEVPVKIWNDLLKNHWDVFGLIYVNLAIDIADVRFK